MSDDTILDVDNCSDISSLSKRFPSDSTGTSDNGTLIFYEEGYRVILAPKCDGVLDVWQSLLWKPIQVEEADRQVRKIFPVPKKV